MNNFLDDIDQKHQKYLNDMKSHNLSIMRRIKIDLMLGNLEFKPNKERLDPLLWEKCLYLGNKGFIIAGSVSCKLHGLLVRDTDDIDIFKPDVEFKGDVKVYSNYGDSGDAWDGGDAGFQRAKYFTKMGTMDIFKKTTPYIEYEGIKFGDPMIAFNAKLKYNRYKDFQDFQELNKLYMKMLYGDNCIFYSTERIKK